MHKRLAVLLILACILLACYACRGPASWCTDPSGRECRDGNVEAEATLDYNSQEDEEVVEEHEHVVAENVLEYEEEAQTQFFKFPKLNLPARLGKPLVPVKPKAKIEAFIKAIKKGLGFRQNVECHSDCRWLRNEQMVCDKCKYPWALYNKASNNGECVSLRNIWSLMRNNPDAITKYANRCKVDALCECKKPTVTGGSFFKSFLVGLSNMITRIKTNMKYCQYQCKDFIMGIHPKYFAVYEALKKEVDQVTVTVDKESFDPAIGATGKCPKKNDVAVPMSTEQRESLTQYCFYLAKQAYMEKNNLTEEQFNKKVTVFKLFFGHRAFNMFSSKRFSFAKFK